jgi:hypothetical protein
MTQTPFTGSPFRTPESPDGAPAPKRRGRPPGSKNTGGGRRKRSLKTEIGGTLTLLNMGVQLSPLSRDALDAIEINALAEGLDEEARKSPQFRKYLEYAIGVTGAGGNLYAVLAIIATRRAARHGYLPEVVDQQLGTLLAMSTGKLGDVDKMMAEMPEPSPFQPADVEFPSDSANGSEPVVDDEPIASPINPFGTSEVKVDE